MIVKDKNYLRLYGTESFRAILIEYEGSFVSATFHESSQLVAEINTLDELFNLSGIR